MTSELYINGIRVDVDNTITMKLVSNVLGGIDKIESNRSYTIHLPRTRNNDTAMGWAALPTVSAPLLRRFLRCDYYIGGVSVIENGRAYITRSTDEDYEVCLVWGDCPALVRMKSDNKKLSQLTSRDDWFVYTKQPTIDKVSKFLGLSAYGFADYDSNVAGDVLPCVTPLYILAMIQSEYGVTFTIPEDALTELGKWLIALTTRRMANDGDTVTVDTGAAVTNGVINQTWQTSGYNTMYFNQSANVLRLIYTNKYHCNTWRFRASSPSQPFIVKLTSKDGTVNTYYSSNISTGQGIDVPLSNIDVEADIIVVTITGLGGVPVTEQVELRLTADIESEDDVTEGEGYRITPNLPDMTCVDFIKEICSRLGLNAMRNGSNTVIDLLSVDTILERAPQPIWLLDVQEVTYALDGWAQRNRFVHTEDDWSQGEHGGTIYVDNETIERSRDAFKSKFICGVGNYLPLYTIERREVDDGEGNTRIEESIKVNKLKAHIGRLKSTTPTDDAALTFSGMDYAYFIQHYWQGMVGLLTEAVQVTGSVILRPWQVKALDMERPVYDGTTNTRYLIVEASGNDKDIYKIRLIKA